MKLIDVFRHWIVVRDDPVNNNGDSIRNC
jgi:hypothetical protein